MCFLNETSDGFKDSSQIYYVVLNNEKTTVDRLSDYEFLRKNCVQLKSIKRSQHIAKDRNEDLSVNGQPLIKIASLYNVYKPR
jgi:ligand-binding sensor protein